MTATVIKLEIKTKAAKKPQSRKPARIIEQAHREADKAGSTQDLSQFPVLGMLAWLAKTARPRARSVELCGVRFLLSSGLWARVVICPRTGRRLVGAVML
jgi:hypothetical protein